MPWRYVGLYTNNALAYETPLTYEKTKAVQTETAKWEEYGHGQCTVLRLHIQ
jgi:hypothetical protein